MHSQFDQRRLEERYQVIEAIRKKIQDKYQLKTFNYQSRLVKTNHNGMKAELIAELKNELERELLIKVQSINKYFIDS